MVDDAQRTAAEAPHVWLIRAGEKGQAEELALRDGYAVIGWTLLGPLNAQTTRDEIKARIRDVYGERRPQSLAAQAGELYRFVNEVQLGDLVVLPLRTKSRQVAVGSVAGSYQFKDDEALRQVDAANTRAVSWHTRGAPYELFDEELQRAFGQQGALSMIGIDDAATRIRAGLDPISLIVKWSAKYGPDTLERHRAVAETHGAVWWGLRGSPDKPNLSPKWMARIHEQLANRTDRANTHVFLAGPNCWRTSLEGIAVRREEVEEELIPDSGPHDQEYGLWVKLTNFLEVTRHALLDGLELVSKPGVKLPSGALGNQTNPLIVRPWGSAWVNALDPSISEQQHQVNRPPDRPRVWWVCQGATYPTARDSGVLWAPKQAKDGAGRPYWRALQEARPGDRVMHYANGSVRAISTVTEPAVSAPEPNPGAGEWQGEGWLVHTDYHELAEPIPLSAIPAEWRVAEGGPFTQQGSVQQGYFYPLSDQFVEKLGNSGGTFSELSLEQAAGDSAGVGMAPSSEGVPSSEPSSTAHPTNGNIEADPTAFRPTADPPPEPLTDYTEPDFRAIRNTLAEAGLRMDEQTVRRYHVSLKTRGFVVLSGLSGSGKTWLAQLYADAVRARSLLVSVAPNWTTNEDLLGYDDPLSKSYCHTPFSLFLGEAARAWDAAQRAGVRAHPYHLILDEMNLARVEYYFAKFLSAMEVRSRDGSVPLALGNGVSTKLTPNLSFIGTVNVDETTQGFADKIYDRAQLIEIVVREEEIRAHLAERPYEAELLQVWEVMREVAPFAYRVLDDIGGYVVEAQQLDVPVQVALDEQLLQKVLPKVSGTDKRIGEALGAFIDLAADRWPLCHDKATAMFAAYQAHGFTSFF